MPRRGQHDQSPGDRRKPYSDEGGPAGHHATTHDVAREEADTSQGWQHRGRVRRRSGTREAARDARSPGRSHVDESISAQHDKDLRSSAILDADDLAQLAVLTVGSRLEQGSVYVDLDDLDAGPFKALGGQEAGVDNRYVAKRDTDHELWSRLVGSHREPEIERPVDR